MLEELTYTVISLGCPKNRVDSEKIMFVMSSSGWMFTEDPATADVIIINTCAFIEAAVEESINTILDYVSENPNAFIVAAGCLPMRYKSEASESLPEVSLFVEPRDITNLPGMLVKAMNISGKMSHALVNEAPNPKGSRILTTPGYAYLRVSDGCDRKCAYCSIPSIRGEMKSEPVAKLVEEARWLASEGVSELILVAQDLCSYGLDLHLKNGLETLLNELAKIDSVSWIRLMYLHPNGLPERLLDLMKDSEKILPYLDIPIQHISSKVLRDMRRPWNNDIIKKLFDRTRNKVPGLVLRTTVMVGYPTETESDFNELRDFVQDYEIDRVGVFGYSPEEGTEAFSLGDPIPQAEKQERVDQIVEIHSRFMERKNSSRTGAIERAIVEGYSMETDLLLQGRLWDQAPEVDGSLYITDGNAISGGIYNVRINEYHGADFFGEIVEEQDGTQL